MYFAKHGELENLLSIVEAIPAQNVSQIIFGCSTLLLTRLISCQDVVFPGFGRRSS